MRITWADISCLRVAEPPAAKPVLAQDETIINPYYMRQLLTYGIKLGQQTQNADMNPDELLKESEVPSLLSDLLIHSLIISCNSVWWLSLKHWNHSIGLVMTTLFYHGHSTGSAPSITLYTSRLCIHPPTRPQPIYPLRMFHLFPSYFPLNFTLPITLLCRSIICSVLLISFSPLSQVCLVPSFLLVSIFATLCRCRRFGVDKLCYISTCDLPA